MRQTSPDIVHAQLFWFIVELNFVLKAVGNKTRVNEQYIINGENIEFRFTSTFKNATLKFALGEEIDEVTIDGRKCKVGEIKTLLLDCLYSYIFIKNLFNGLIPQFICHETMSLTVTF